MKLSILFTLILVSNVWGGKHLPLEYYLESSKRSAELSKNEAKFRFRFKGIQNETNGAIHLLWSMDSLNTARTTLNDRSWMEVEVAPGKHSFQFFYDEHHFEVNASELEIKGGFQDTYVVIFHPGNITIDKPVIYLYPEKTTEVEVKVEPKGKMLFTYPPLNESWKGTAYPNGDVLINNKFYPYLFWEAEAPVIEFNWEEGFAVSRNEVVSFLEKTLDDFGLNSQERADFITYWAPRMLHSNGCVVHFFQQAECAEIAHLNVLPRPDHLNRVYILWSPVEDIDEYSYLRPQNIQKINRLGFDVLEWGGSEMAAFPRKQKEL